MGKLKDILASLTVIVAGSYAIAYFLVSFLVPNISINNVAALFYIPYGIGFIIYDYSKFKLSLLQRQLDNKQDIDTSSDVDEIIEKCMTVVTCPCGEADIPGVVFVNDENIFTCTKCSSKFRIELVPQTVLVTEPQNIERIFEMLNEKAKEEIKRNSSIIEGDDKA